MSNKQEKAKTATESPEAGPFVHQNWRAEQAGEPSKVAYQFPIFTDADVSGYIADGYDSYQLNYESLRGFSLRGQPKHEMSKVGDEVVTKI